MISSPITKQERLLSAFGDRLRQLRKDRNLRQLDMERLGLSYKYYQRLEAGQVNPTLLTLYKLALAFKVPISHLVCPEQEHDAPTS